MDYFFIADILGMIAFSISGFLVGLRNKLDLLGLVIASSLTALGGGILRDVILNKTPFTFIEYYPALTVLTTISFAFIFEHFRHDNIEKKWIFVMSDTVGLVAFSITGTMLALHAEFNVFGVIFLSFITAVGGGVLRDVMINQVPSVLISDFYGSIALIVATLLYTLHHFDFLNSYTISSVAFFSVALRLIAFKKHWHLPKLQK